MWPGVWERLGAAPVTPVPPQLVAYEVKRMKAEEGNKQKILRHIKELAEKLYKNVSPRALGRSGDVLGDVGSWSLCPPSTSSW